MLTFLFLFSAFLHATPQATPIGVSPAKKINKWFSEEKERTEGRFFRFATLSTLSPEGHPRTRMVEITPFHMEMGTKFFTHKNAKKVTDLICNPFAALNIYLPKTGRQISLEGYTRKIPFTEAEKSWNKMPKFIQLQFLASDHQGKIDSKDILEENLAKIKKEYVGKISMPESFIGYKFLPRRVIFYEINGRSFPNKELAEIEDDVWITSLLQP